MTYKTSSLIIILNTLLRLKAKIKTLYKAILDKTLLTKENKIINVFALTFVKLKEDLS
jgi:hypothetical protein